MPMQRDAGPSLQAEAWDAGNSSSGSRTGDEDGDSDGWSEADANPEQLPHLPGRDNLPSSERRRCASPCRSQGPLPHGALVRPSLPGPGQGMLRAACGRSPAEVPQAGSGSPAHAGALLLLEEREAEMARLAAELERVLRLPFACYV